MEEVLQQLDIGSGEEEATIEKGLSCYATVAWCAEGSVGERNSITLASVWNTAESQMTL